MNTKPYEQIVNDEANLKDLLSFAYYKNSEIQFIKNFKKSYNKSPSKTDLEKFQISALGEFGIKSYQINAEKNLNLLVETSLKLKKEEIEEVLKLQLEEIEKIHTASKMKNFWIGILQSVLGTIFYSLLIILFVFLFYANKNKHIEELILKESQELINENDSIKKESEMENK